MKIFQIHNRYLTGLGGEDTVVDQEMEMLRHFGNNVRQHFINTDTDDISGPIAKTITSLKYIYNTSSYGEIVSIARDFRPDIVHVHNIFPLISPSIFVACKRLNIPVIQTLHNFRWVCANALLMRDSKPCLDCVGHNSLPAIKHRCYKNSLLGSAALTTNRLLWKDTQLLYRYVDRFIVLSEFARSIFVESGFPYDKIRIKNNFLHIEKIQKDDSSRENIVFVGKIVKEKGLDLLIDSWKLCKTNQATLDIIGDGPERFHLEQLTKDIPSIRWHGWKEHSMIMKYLQKSKCLVIPSRWFEGQPMVMVEAFASGLPVIAPDHGAFREFVPSSLFSLLFLPNDITSLASKIESIIDMPYEQWSIASEAVSQQYEEKFSKTVNYSALMKIYEDIIK